MRIALMGSVSSSYAVLEAFIHSGVDVSCVLGVGPERGATISDYRDLMPLARDAGIPYLPFVRVREPDVESFLRTHTFDQLWVIGLSQLVPDHLIDLAPEGGVGFHPTMLPEGRGRAPVAWTILKGARAAVSLFHLTAEADAGDLVAQREVEVLPDDYSWQLVERTNEVLGEVIKDLAPAIKSGTVQRTPQDHSRATFYPKRTPEDGVMNWSSTTDHLYRLIRAAGRPYPGAFCSLEGERLTIWQARLPGPESELGSSPPRPGEILQVNGADEALVSTSDGALWISDVAWSLEASPWAHLKPGTVLA